MGILSKLRSGLKGSTIDDYGFYYKAKMNSMTKTEFDKFKVAGVFSRKKDIGDISRGRMKFEDIVRQTRIKPAGKVLSLACGRGGWEQAYAGSPDVHSITCVTYGSHAATPGHEDFTNRPFKGKGKVKLAYMDIRKYVRLTDVKDDFILFDGGESHSNYADERDKFYDLFHNGVVPAIHENVKGFILKILTPFDTRILEDLRRIQNITGMGNFICCGYSRQTTCELYFVSTKPPMNLEKSVRALIDAKLRKAEASVGTKQIGPVLKKTERELGKIDNDVKLLKRLDMTKSIGQLGPRMFEAGRNFLHWESLGVYGFGSRGGMATIRVQLMWEIIRGIANHITNYFDWNTTDTTPEGFEKVFIRKVDTSPVENSPNFVKLKIIYGAMSRYFKGRGFKLSELTYDEVSKRCNKQGAAGVQDVCKDVGSFVSESGWEKTVEENRNALLSGRPMNGVFNTMGKREKKRGGEKGSRMIAFLPIPLRLLELKVFGKLLDLTKPFYNRFGVGGVGLHDFGMRMKQVFKEWSCSDDVAGFDTRIGLKMLSLEFYEFIKPLVGAGKHLATMEGLYRIYAYPHLLIPMPSDYVRSELVAGRGQRMSGTGPTYSMNTITRLAIAILQFAEADGIDTAQLGVFTHEVLCGKTEWNGLCSGDDFFVTSSADRVIKYSKTWNVLNDIGFFRKDMVKDLDTKTNDSMGDTEFCSHRYEEVSYYDDYTGKVVKRWQPCRAYGEIFAKASIWISGNDVAEDQEAWLSAQGNNLLINYHQMRDCRRVGFAIKSVVNPNIILRERGKASYMPRPWMREGQILDILNECLFGGSTMFPERGFRVNKWQHFGYIGLDRELEYECNFGSRNYVDWRNELPFVVARLSRGIQNSVDYMRNMTRYRPIIKRKNTNVTLLRL